MSDVHAMYEQLTRSIDAMMPSLVASLVPDEAIPGALDATNNLPSGDARKAQATVTNLSQSSVSRGRMVEGQSWVRFF
jgi:hypothetical protein